MMSFRDVLAAIGAAVLVLPVLAAAAFGLLTWSIERSDGAAISAALGAMDPADRGVPEIDQTRNGFREGFFPECAGLSQLLRQGSVPSAEAAAVKAETIMPENGQAICADLATVLSGAGEAIGWFTYARYWHGSLVLHRWILSGDSYADLQAAAGWLVWAGLGTLVAAFAWRVGWRPALALGGVLALLNDTVAVGALPMQAVSVAALFGLAAMFAALAADLRGTAGLIAAVIAGAAYNFFDFFCNPECLAALCAWAWLARGVARGERRAVLDAVLIFGAVLGGYGAFWACKWAIAAGYAVSGGDVYLFGFGDVERWGPANDGWQPGRALLAVLGHAFDAWWKIGVAMGVAVAVGFAWWAKRRLVGGRSEPAARVETARHGSSGLRFAAPEGDKLSRSFVLMVPVLLGLATIELLAGHTLAHTAIAVRIVPVALGLIAASVLLQMIPASRKAAMSDAA